MVSAGSLRGAVRLYGGLVRSHIGVTPKVTVLGAENAVTMRSKLQRTVRNLIPGFSCPTGFLFNKYLGLFHWGWKGRSLKLSTRPHLVQRFRMSGDVPPLPLCAVDRDNFWSENEDEQYDRRWRGWLWWYLVFWLWLLVVLSRHAGVGS